MHFLEMARKGLKYPEERKPLFAWDLGKEKMVEGALSPLDLVLEHA
jgi:hypothetical protein